MSPFKVQTSADEHPDSPEAVFRTLRPTDGNVKHPWAHQADSLRGYAALARSIRDVALELPTGSGKTLVSYLICEYRRRTLGQRVAFLCPTIQLAKQAIAHGSSYGIGAVDLTGPQADYDNSDFTAYQRGKAIGVSTYHGLFNVNPRIDSPQTILFDDAHAGEGPVANMWTVDADRDDGQLYAAMRDVFLDVLPPGFAERLVDDGADPTRRAEVELVAPDFVIDRADAIRDVLAAHAQGHNSWASNAILDQVDRCVVYVSWHRITIRPVVAPTAFHPAFANADQRIYVSATLGSGGELERSFGVPRIERVPVPESIDEHGSGRRFFLFPDNVLSRSDADSFTERAIAESGRAVCITPSNSEMTDLAARAVPNKFVHLTAKQFEADPDSFSKQDDSVLLLANRYDGVDLPDDSCRLIILAGLPWAMHLQERFLSVRLQATNVLAERVRTRIVQGSGRCTRNSRDYAAVIVRGEHLTDFCARDENVRPMSAELQAELNFGFENSEDADQDLDELLKLFMEQGAEWGKADAAIAAASATQKSTTPVGAQALADSAEHEVEACNAAWGGDFAAASERAVLATDSLIGGEEMRPYRTLWFTLAASWARAGNAEEKHVEALQTEANGCALRLPWRPMFERASRPTTPDEPLADLDRQADAAAVWLRRAGIRGSKFEQKVATLFELIGDDESGKFERGTKMLGRVLGLAAARPGKPAAPDGIWRDDSRTWFLWEAKSEESETNPISAQEVRQAVLHLEWSKQEYKSTPERSKSFIITYKTTVTPDAAQLASGLYVISPDELRELAEKAVAVQRSVRAQARRLTEVEMSQAFSAAFEESGLDARTLLDSLATTRVVDLDGSAL